MIRPLLLLLLAMGMTLPAVQAAETALDRYVAKADPSYGFTLYHSENKVIYATYFLQMTSQTWRNATEVDRTVWQHNMMVIVPLQLRNTGAAILLISGGGNDGAPPRDTDQEAAALAVALETVVVVLGQIPNEPLAFSDEFGRRRSEDEILAYSFDKFLRTGDEEWPVHLAMTKAVVRAMDTAQVGLATKGIQIDKFILSGGSKRGWTSWLAAAVDPRVKAVVPASFDALHLDANLKHHWEAYGFYAPALDDYVEFDIPCRIDTPEGADLLRIVDPYSYRDRFTQPKLIANSAGDQFFLPDSSQFYFGDLVTPKRLRYTPNTDHAQSTDVMLSAAAWVEELLDSKPGPQFDWSIQADGSIRVETLTIPSRVRLWQATNPNARDFRLEAIGPVWTSTDLQDSGGGVFVGSVSPPPKGWTAFMVELTFQSASILEPAQVYTTEIRVTPDTLPFAGTECSASTPAKIGVFRDGRWRLDLNGNGVWDGCTVDGCIGGFGQVGDHPVVGDWNGDGLSDIGVFRAGDFFLDVNGNRKWDGCDADGCFSFGEPGDMPVAGDWNRDGSPDLGVFRDGVFLLDQNGNRQWDNRSVDSRTRFGRAGDVPVVGDWNRDGFSDIGVFRNGRFLLDWNGNRRWDGCSIDRCSRFGKAGDLPVIGDWNNDGAGDGIGVKRGRRWLLDRNDNGVLERDATDFVFKRFGLKSDVPVGGRWGP